MADQEQRRERDEAALPASEGSQVVQEALQEMKIAYGEALDSIAVRRQQKLQRLSERREQGEISPYDIDLNFIDNLVYAGLPLTRREMEHQTGMQALVLTREDLKRLGGHIDYISSSGQRERITLRKLDPGDVFILQYGSKGNICRPSARRTLFPSAVLER